MKLSLSLLLLLFYSFGANGQIQLMNDEFDDANSLDDWSNITDFEGWTNGEHLNIFDVNTSAPQRLFMQPWTTSWFANWRGPLLFKEIDGDFSFTTELTVSNLTGTGIPQSLYSLAGLMIRESTGNTTGSAGWSAGQEDYIFLSLGYADSNHPSLPVRPTPPPHMEIKTTNNSNSNLMVSGMSTLENVQLRISRIGNYIICLYKEPDSEWQIRNRYFRNDFPTTLQAGFVTYTDWPKLSTYTPSFANANILNDDLVNDPNDGSSQPFSPDLIAEFEFARFDSIVVPVHLQGLNLADPNVVSDSLVLSFLGFPSQPYIENNIHYILNNDNVQIVKDNNNNFINIEGDFSSYDIFILDATETVLDTLVTGAPLLTIDLDELPDGLHFIFLEHQSLPDLNIQRIIKE